MQRFPNNTVRAHYNSPLGPMTLCGHDQALTGVWFDGQKHQPDPQAWPLVEDHALLQRAQAQLAEYFAGTRQHFDLPLDYSSATAFQQQVWSALLTIPRGQTLTYAAISRHIGRPSAVRAVGSAIGRNPLCIVVPCHRVLGGDGSLTGYAGGLERKVALLQLEQAL